MNKKGLVKVKCKHQNANGTCNDINDDIFDCGDLEEMRCDDRDGYNINQVTWTTYLINKQHLIEVDK